MKDSKQLKPAGSREWKRVCFFIVALPLLLLVANPPVLAATNDLTTLLQRGLFEEEANRDLNAAIARYDALAREFDKDRNLAATAIFRLGECYRKMGRTNDAAMYYQRILREFSDQEILATLSRQNLAGMGGVGASPQERPLSGETDVAAEARTLAAKLDGLEQFKDDPEKQARAVLSLFPDDLLRKMLANLRGLQEQESAIRAGQKLSSYRLATQARLDLLSQESQPSEKNLQWAGAETGKQVRWIQERVNEILSEQRLRLDVLRAVAEASPGSGMSAAAGPTSAVEAAAEAQTSRLELEMIKSLPESELRIYIQQNHGNPVLMRLFENLEEAEQRVISSAENYTQEHPVRRAAAEAVKAIEQRIDAQVQGVLRTLTLKQAIAEERAKALRAQSGPRTAPESPGTAVLDEEEKEIRRIQAMIRNSPDLINAPTGDPSLTPLARAASQGYLRVADYLIRNGANINQTSGTGNRTPLHHAVFNGHRKMAELLISNGADVNAQDPGRVTPLFLAVERRFQSLVELLLTSKADPNLAASQTTSRADETPLMQAVRNGSESIVSLLLAHGADLNRVNRAGRERPSTSTARGEYGSALHMAAARAFPGMTALLLTNGASVKVLDLHGETALHVAAAKGITSNTVQLILAGADVNASGLERETGGVTPLALAVSAGHVETVRLLLENGANPNTAVVHGRPGVTPLMIAAGAGHVEILSLLVKAGAQGNVEDSAGSTALVRAVEARSPESVKVLLEHGANPNTTRSGWPVMTLAITDYADSGVLAELIRAKADVNAIDPDGGTPLHRAVGMKRKDMVEQLLAAGANPNLRNRSGQTSLDLVKPSAAFPGAVRIPTRPALPAPPSGLASDASGKSTPADLETLLRRHGALDDVPDFSVIKVRWLGQESGVIAWRAHTNGWNRFTLVETLVRQPGSDFPDYGRILIHRPAGRERLSAVQIPVNLLNATNGIDCTKDVWLEFGDVVEIPERDHPLAEKARELRNQQLLLMSSCMRRQVQLSVRDQTRVLELWNFPTLARALAEPAAKSLLLSSSDLSRVKVIRKIPGREQPVQMTVNIAANPSTEQDLWLRDGDVIQVPEK